MTLMLHIPMLCLLLLLLLPDVTGWCILYQFCERLKSRYCTGGCRRRNGPIRSGIPLMSRFDYDRLYMLLWWLCLLVLLSIIVLYTSLLLRDITHVFVFAKLKSIVPHVSIRIYLADTNRWNVSLIWSILPNSIRWCQLHIFRVLLVLCSPHGCIRTDLRNFCLKIAFLFL